MPYDWGPHFIVPSELLTDLSGHVLLREYFDEEKLVEELRKIGVGGNIEGAANPWYYRKKNSDTWIKIGESSDRSSNFAVSWDTVRIPNGEYEVMGSMHIFLKNGGGRHAVARQRIVEVTIRN